MSLEAYHTLRDDQRASFIEEASYYYSIWCRKAQKSRASAGIIDVYDHRHANVVARKSSATPKGIFYFVRLPFVNNGKPVQLFELFHFYTSCFSLRRHELKRALGIRRDLLDPYETPANRSVDAIMSSEFPIVGGSYALVFPSLHAEPQVRRPLGFETLPRYIAYSSGFMGRLQGHVESPGRGLEELLSEGILAEEQIEMCILTPVIDRLSSSETRRPNVQLFEFERSSGEGDVSRLIPPSAQDYAEERGELTLPDGTIEAVHRSVFETAEAIDTVWYGALEQGGLNIAPAYHGAGRDPQASRSAPFSLRKKIVQILKDGPPADTVDQFLSRPAVQSILAQCKANACGMMKTFLRATDKATPFDSELRQCGMTREQVSLKINRQFRQAAHVRTLEPEIHREMPIGLKKSITRSLPPASRCPVHLKSVFSFCLFLSFCFKPLLRHITYSSTHLPLSSDRDVCLRDRVTTPRLGPCLTTDLSHRHHQLRLDGRSSIIAKLHVLCDRPDSPCLSLALHDQLPFTMSSISR